MSETPPPPEVHLYVKSRKVVTSFYRPQSGQMATPADTAGVATASPNFSGAGTGDAQVEFMLSDEQARVVALVEEVASKRGYSLKLSDLGRSNPLSQMLEQHLRGVDRYPVLLVPGSPIRLEGPEAFTIEQLSATMPAEPTYQRSFSYLKVKTNDIERVRKALLEFKEVKEIHLITGDWDLLVMMEFPPREKAGKRHVLDFIIDKVAKVNGVEDTSTMVPEYTVTKLPI